MEKKELKKIPIVTYLLYLLVVSALLAGVTFARYSTFTSGDVSTDIAGFRCSYSINDMSSNTFSNADYWLEPDDGSEPTPLNTARTVRYTLSNSSAGIVSEVDLQAAIRLYAPRNSSIRSPFSSRTSTAQRPSPSRRNTCSAI